MALPAPATNSAIDGGVAGSRPDLVPRTSSVVQNTAFAATTPAGAAVTCNLATDTLIWRADGCLWDDTQACWLPPYIYQLGPTPRK